MTFRFNLLLQEVGVDPAEVRLLRHQPLIGGRHLADVWRADRASFEDYQSLQLIAKRTSFRRPFWASFIGTWDGRTMFVGLYSVGNPEPLMEAVESPISGSLEAPEQTERYPTSRLDLLAQYEGRLYIDWGGGSSGKRAWVQRAEFQNKLITELHLDAVERPFPGLMELTTPLSGLTDAPAGWVQALAAARGIYLLICPRDGSQYIGSATGSAGFWGRWEEYRLNGHGGNVALVGRERTDWRASILEVAGSADTPDDILAKESRWKRKLGTGEFGLTRN